MLEAPPPTEPKPSPSTAQAAMVEALLAGEGFAGVARMSEELVGATVEILLPRPGSDGLEGTATERFVARLAAGEEPEPPAEVTATASIEAGGEPLGAVVMIGEGIPEAEEYLRAAAVASLTGVAMLNARDEAGRDRRQGLIAELLAGADMQASEVVRRAREQGCDLTAGVCAICVSPGPEARAAARLRTRVTAARPDALAEVCGEKVFALLPGPVDPVRRLTTRLGEQSNEVITAFSSLYRKAGDARLALEEAELLLALVETGGRRDTAPATWDSLRLLFRSFIADPTELEHFAERTVGSVVRHDERHGTELQDTFWAFEESNCNMNTTARATYTHRHTVSNRLSRIEDLTGLDPLRSYDRELLSMAFKATSVISLAPRR
jgi:sugar diacid utilization regulator